MTSVSHSNHIIWRESQWQLALLATALSVLLIPFMEGLNQMVDLWSTKDEYSHGFLLPVISLYLLYQKKNELLTTEFTGSWFGVLLVLAGLMLGVVGDLSTLYVIIQYAFLLTLIGLVVSYTGLKGFKHIWVPFLILVLMIPLPNFLYQNISAHLQLISSEIGVAVVRLFGIPVFLEGNIIDLGEMKLQVVDACSGLRYLFPLMTVGFIMAYFFQGPLIFRALVFISTVPVTILMNSIRIGLIGVSVEYWGPQMAEGILHDFEGWIVFMACFFILIAEIWLFTRLAGIRRPLNQVMGIVPPGPLPKDAAAKSRQIPASLYASIVLITLFIIPATQLSEREEIKPDRTHFVFFPQTFAQWRGNFVPMEQRFINTLKFDDYVIEDFKDSSGNRINFYTAYYASQKKGVSAHSPRSCMPSGGWRIESLDTITLQENYLNGQPLNVNRTFIVNGEHQSIVYYWFQQRGKIITNEYLVKWHLLVDSIVKQRTDGALVRFVLPLNDDESIEAQEDRLKQLVLQVSQVLPEFVPN